MRPREFVLAFLLGAATAAAQPYDLLLKGGHVIDPRNEINQPMDVALVGGKIARVAAGIPAADARKTVDVGGLYVTPGLVDLHVHVYLGTGEARAYAGDRSVLPDGFLFRTGVTTAVDAGTSGWRNFPDFKERVIDRQKSRVLALLNIAGGGMGPAPNTESDPADMDPKVTADMAKSHPQIVVGIKSAHYGRPDWTSIERAVEAGNLANIPVMVDFGTNFPERPIGELFMKKLRPGDIYTHCFSGNRVELLPEGTLNPAMLAGRKRGILFDIGHGGGSFRWNVAVQAYKENFPPDTISTDLHTGSMNAGMKDQLNVMSKMLNLGSPLYDVIQMSTSRPAMAIKRPELGHLSEGAIADVAVIRLDHGVFGLVDSGRARYTGDKLLTCEMTLFGGEVVWDLNGRAGEHWKEYYSRPEPEQRRGRRRGR